ncbi:uncharacterized protein DUF4340 [Roseimicrobium gellanilyticum]|uniref:Uncharacterized protein DUF4340 n=1 Tax=Roseimicrobium gellanilyticum TaxID=748857 RepID=A0A366HU35_9BACT|nr:DUF4340 domain-containing protein [Roseimicrobium gellanilyticum]RBP47796.1 uncharacterized protein DUF4340 [Roseimicrobium gellanilyticum]
MKLRTTILLFVLTAGLAAFIVLWEQKQPATQERLAREKRPFAVDVQHADSIEIVGADLSLRLTREPGGLWFLNKPVEDRANQELVKQFLESMTALTWVEKLKKSDMRKDDFKRTGLGEPSTRVTVRQGSEKLLQCFFGATSPVEGTSYASLGEDAEDFFLAKSGVQPLLDKPSDDWRDNKLVRLKLEHIGRFTLSAGTGSMEFTREPNQPWRLTKPIQARASDERVSSVLQALLKMQVKPVRGKVPTPPADPGQALPMMKVSFGTGVKGQQPVDVTFQPPSAAGAEIVAEVGDRSGTYLAPAKLADFWKLQPNHLRDQRLGQIPEDRVSAIRLHGPGFPEVKLTRAGELWMLQRFGKEEPANQARIQRLLEGINTANVVDFVTDAATNLDLYGLNQPFLTLEWTVDGKTTSLLFGQANDQVCAKYADETSVFKVNPLMPSAIMPPDLVKWKGTRVINASIFAVRRIIVAEGDKPALTLHYNPDDSTWKAELAGADVTEKLDKAGANTLLKQLASFDASDWSADRSAAFEALKGPTLTVQVLIAPPGQPDAKPEVKTLIFAPSTPGMSTAVYHGRLNEEPDTFLISRDLYQQLSRTLVK